MNNVLVQSSPLKTCHLLAEYISRLACQIVTENGSFHVALSGGKTPCLLYSILSTPAYANKMPWQNIHIYLSDERFVPFSHYESNSGMLKKTLIKHVPALKENTYFIHTHYSTPKEAALHYEIRLKKNLPENHKPVFDLILLGLGEDGHIASLFPETAILTATNKIADAVFIKKYKQWRISLTFDILNNAKQIAFLVTGKNKSFIIKKYFDQPNIKPILPVNLLKSKKRLIWFLDKDAAEKL